MLRCGAGRIHLCVHRFFVINNKLGISKNRPFAETNRVTHSLSEMAQIVSEYGFLLADKNRNLWLVHISHRASNVSLVIDSWSKEKDNTDSLVELYQPKV